MVTPPGLRASVLGPSSSATVSLPSITRAIRIHVVSGNCRSAGAGTSARSSDDEAEAAGLEDQVHRLQRASAVAASRGSRAGARDRGPPPAPTADRSDRAVSTSATASPRAAAAAAMPTNSAVRPDDRGPIDLRQMPAPQAAAERRVERGTPVGAIRSSSVAAPGRGGRQRHIELAGAQERFDLRARRSHFAFSSPRRPSILRSFHRIKTSLRDPDEKRLPVAHQWFAINTGRLARTADSPPRARGVHLSRFPRPLVRRLHLDRRHLDAEGRAELARLRADQIVVLPRARRFPRAAADPAVHAGRRRHRRPARSPAPAARLAVRADGDGVHAGRARLLGKRPHLAHPRALVRHRDRRRPSAVRRISR